MVYFITSTPTFSSSFLKRRKCNVFSVFILTFFKRNGMCNKNGDYNRAISEFTLNTCTLSSFLGWWHF